ncbi:MAG TPA: purine-nucleoside phosphorylase [Saprospiraceae bacterium]|nr:purine-nucleoside phosphorylase [Saprospiraceae bacterium]
MYRKIQDATHYILQKTTLRPKVGIILGTGLSGLADEIEEATYIPYGEIPNFPVSTVASHKGQLIIGLLEGQPVIAMAGRFHYYEGYSMKEVTFPVRVFQMMGVERLIVSNAAGGVNPDYSGGDIIVIRDHINLFPENPLRGANDERLGVRFPDMMHTYDEDWRQKALRKAKELGLKPQTGVYLGMQGPNLETPAEYVFAHNLSADLVGMSTIPEVIVARHAGIKVLALSVVSNVSYPPSRLTETTMEEVIATVQAVSPKMVALVKEVLTD